MNLSRRAWPGLLGLLAMTIPAGCGGGGTNPELPPPGVNEFRIGALLSLTGNWNTLGKASKAAVELAQEDVNAYFAQNNVSTRVRVMVADTKLEPARALTEMNRLAGGGTKVFVGPQSSAEVAGLKPTVDTTGNILISQGSTASSLSVENDNVFRLVPDDLREAMALVALLEADGIKAIVPVAREDAGNGGLYNSTRARFTAGGGVVSTGVRYGADVTDFTATLATIKAQVEELRLTNDAAEVGIYLAAFDEAAAILAAAKDDAVLSTVKWYGSDGVVQSAALTANENAAAFAVQSGFPNPIFGLDDANVGTWGPVAARIKARSGVDADAFALSAYDAVWLAALAHRSAGGTGNMAAYRSAFITTANGYTGLTGSTKLDAAGDRDSGNFDFWGIVGATGNFQWKRVAVYKAADGSIVRTP
ncbi:MAG: ABC transporter substrate-binding protein [Fimbriimonas sp.]